LADEIQTSKNKSALRETIEAVVIALILALFIRTFIIQAFKIPSSSMLDTLLIGDHLLVNKFSYGVKNPFTGETWVPLGTPERKDIIVFKYPENPSQDFIKRVVGLAGDKIQIINKKLFINDKPFEVTQAKFEDKHVIPSQPGNMLQNPRDNFGPVVVPENSVFVLGDNRDNSKDSRYWGFVDLKAIKGKAFILYWSWDREATMLRKVRWGRIADLIH